MSEAVVGAIIGFVGVLVGAGITQGAAFWQRRARHRSYWQALRAEVEICREHGDAYLADSVNSPAYRLPMKAYENALPGLLQDGAISHDEAKAVLAYYTQVDQMNRVLEQAHAAWVSGREDDLKRESDRLALKARHVSAGDKYYRRLQSIFDHHATQRLPLSPNE